MRVLVTGATGFVGSVLCGDLARAGHEVRAALRTERAVPATVGSSVVVGDISGDTDWGPALSGVDAVVHLAARVHVMHGHGDQADLYRRTNTEATAGLARAAANNGVSRLVYLSSIKVNGEQSPPGGYAASDTPRPQDPYGQSKWLAEVVLGEIAASSSMQTAVIRPPLVYGAGVRANFLRLLRWVDQARPLPLGAIENRRSLVSVWNLSDLLCRVLDSRAPAGRTWLVSDGEDLSTPELIRRIAHAMHRRVRLLRVSPSLLGLAGTLLGKQEEIARLRGSLTVDITHTRRELDWSPPVSVDEALARTVAWYLNEGRA